MSKIGSQYLESLRDGRAVYLDGRRIEQPVPDHPAFRNAAQSIAALYDYQHAHQESMTFRSPGNGRQVNRAWQLPKTRDDLVCRAEAHLAWARLTGGWLGRAPDHVPGALVGMVIGRELFDRADARRGAAVQGYYEWARDHDITLAFTIVNPQGDRSRGVSEQGAAYHTLGVVDEDAAGLTVRGAKMLGTAAVLAEEILVGVQNPLQPQDGAYALSFAMPLAAKGIKILARRSYELAATSAFDYPLASRYDENDAILYFDDVKVPWDRVFIHRRPELCSAMFHRTPAEALFNFQSQARLVVKLQFLLGVARRMAETTGAIHFAAVQDTLGRLAAEAMAVEGTFRALTHDPREHDGHVVPDAALVYAATAIGQALYPRFVNDIRGLAGGGLIMLPSSVRDFDDPELARLIGQTQRSSATTPEGRVRLMKLAWDALGSEFGSRQQQYEMFYSGPAFVQHGRCYGAFDWRAATAMVDELLTGAVA